MAESVNSPTPISISPRTRSTRDYWRQSRRPLTSLLFVFPLLAVYEGGVVYLGPEAVRNGADVWLQQLLDVLGVGGYLLLPFLTVFILLAWHYTTRESWRVSGLVLYAMAAESYGAGPLAGDPRAGAVGAAVDLRSRWAHGHAVCLGDRAGGPLVFHRTGAVLRRGFTRRCCFADPAADGDCSSGNALAFARIQVFGGVVLTSLAFSTAHYVGPYGEPLTAYTFVFRFVAGAVFGMLFVYRGFGIAAGTTRCTTSSVGFPVLEGSRSRQETPPRLASGGGARAPRSGRQPWPRCGLRRGHTSFRPRHPPQSSPGGC